MRDHLATGTVFVKGVEQDGFELSTAVLDAGDASQDHMPVLVKMGLHIIGLKKIHYKAWSGAIRMLRWVLQSRVDTRLDLARFGRLTPRDRIQLVKFTGYQAVKLYHDSPKKKPKVWNDDSEAMPGEILADALKLVRLPCQQQRKPDRMKNFEVAVTALQRTLMSRSFDVTFNYEHELRSVLSRCNAPLYTEAKRDGPKLSGK